MTPREHVFQINEKELGDNPIAAADRFFDSNMGIHKLLVVDDAMRLRGLFTLTDIERIKEEQRSEQKPARDSQFRLVCGAAISASRKASGDLDRDRILGHAHNLVKEGVDVLAVSTAHGHTRGVARW
jgi:IMP dehydrogenase